MCAHFNSSYLNPSLIPFGCYSARSSGTTNSMLSNLSVISCTLHSPPGATRKRSGKVGTKISLLILWLCWTRDWILTLSPSLFLYVLCYSLVQHLHGFIEYTDLFIADARGDIPSASRRWALVALEALAKPIGRRLKNASRNAVSGVGAFEKQPLLGSSSNCSGSTSSSGDKEKERNKSALKKQFLKIILVVLP